MRGYRISLAIGLLLTVAAWAAEGGGTLAERLGYRAADRLLIINGDDAGMCHAANAGTLESLEQGLMTTATIMVPCPWFPPLADHARQHPGLDFGVHLTHTSEWKLYRWGPVSARAEVPTLVDPEGHLWRSVPEVYTQAKPEEALVEGRAQIRRALAAGVDVTHLDSHMGTLQLDLRFVEVYRQLVVEFDLPVRMASQATLEKFGQPGLRARFARDGIVFPDYFIYEELKEEPADVKGFWLRVVRNLQPGVTEVYIHAAKPTDELRAITGSWKTRGEEFEVFTHDAEMRRVLSELGIIRIGYRPLRELQRAERRRASEPSTPSPSQRL
jgi:hypothetical protein